MVKQKTYERIGGQAMKFETVHLITALFMWITYTIITISCLILINSCNQINQKLNQIIELNTPELIKVIPENYIL